MKPEGWGPWNVRAVNALVHLPSGLELRIGIRTPDGVEHWELRWKHMERLGMLREWAKDGGYYRTGEMLLRIKGFSFAITFRSSYHHLAFSVVPLNEEATVLTAVFRLGPSSMGTVAALEKRIIGHVAGQVALEPDDGHRSANWISKLVSRRTLETGVKARLLKPGGADVAVPLAGAMALLGTVHMGSTPYDLVEIVGDDIAVPCLFHFTDGMMPPAELDEALWRGVAWNTIFHPRLKRLMTPVSRDWCVDENNFGDYVLFPWDTFFCSLLASRRDQDLAYANVRAVLAEMTDRGMLPNVAGGAGQTLDRSQPPVGAYCVWKLHQKFNDLEFLAEVYPPLKRWHGFWMKYRDGNGDGLLEWGSDPIPAPVDWWKPHTQQAAKWESGLDNSPMYENVPFNEEANTLELADIGLNCLYAADADALANIAEALGLADEAETYRAEYAQVAKRINEDLWDEEHGIYCNRHWDGRLSDRWSPTSFYALYAGVATPERAERCVREHLMNPDEFWGEWVIPSISRKDPNFPVQKYWQGRVWPPMNFLCYEGLRRYGFHTEADELAAKSEALFLKEWREEGHIHENYNAITADGDDVNPDDPEGSSDPIYTWGGLLAYIALDSRERGQESGSGIQP